MTDTATTPIQRILEIARQNPDLVDEKGEVKIRALARLAGVDHTTILRAKGNASSKMAKPTAQKFAKALGVALDEFWSETGSGDDSVDTAETPDDPNTAGVVFASLEQIYFSPLNPRKSVDNAVVERIAESIAEKGILQFPKCRPHQHLHGCFELMIGETRIRALRHLHEQGRWDHEAKNIPITVQDATDLELIEIALIENLQRNNLNPMEEAEGFAQMHVMGKMKPSQIAARLGYDKDKGTRYVQQRLSFNERLSDEAKNSLRTGLISVSHARLLTMTKHEKQNDLIKRIDRFARVEDLKNEILQGMVPASRAIFDVKTFKGEIVTSDDTGNKYFANRAEFLECQKAAAQKMASDLKKEFAWVDFDESGYFNPHNSYAFSSSTHGKQTACAVITYALDGMEAKVAGKPGAVIHFNPADGKVTQHLGLGKLPKAKPVKKPVADPDPEEADGDEDIFDSADVQKKPADYDAEFRRQRDQLTTLSNDLQEALQGDRAGALALLALLPALPEDNLFPIDGYNVTGISFEKIKDGFWSFLGGMTTPAFEDEPNIHVLDQEANLFDAWKMGRNTQAETIMAALVSYASALVVVPANPHAFIHPFIFQLADHYGVEVPAGLRPAPSAENGQQDEAAQ